MYIEIARFTVNMISLLLPFVGTNYYKGKINLCKHKTLFKKIDTIA